MAKRRKNNSRKHTKNQENQSFLPNLQESEKKDWKDNTPKTFESHTSTQESLYSESDDEEGYEPVTTSASQSEHHDTDQESSYESDTQEQSTAPLKEEEQQRFDGEPTQETPNQDSHQQQFDGDPTQETPNQDSHQRQFDGAPTQDINNQGPGQEQFTLSEGPTDQSEKISTGPIEESKPEAPPITNENDFTIGVYLKEARENQKITLKNVSQSTKISFTNLESLEGDLLSSLPNRAYVAGYVKSYAKLLGLDVNFCIKLLDKTYLSQGAETIDPEIVIPQAQYPHHSPKGLPILKIGIGLVATIIIGAIAIFFINRKDNNLQSSVAPKNESQKIQPQTLNAKTPLQEEISENVSFQSAAIQSESTQEDKDTSEQIEVKIKKDRKFYPLNLPLYSINESLSSEQLEELLPAKSRVVPQAGFQTIFINAHKGDSWLTYKKDAEPIKKFILKQGRSFLFTAKEARVFLGNIGAVTIFLNNRPLKVDSRSGVKSIVFPQEIAKKYVMPLFIFNQDGSVITSEDFLTLN